MLLATYYLARRIERADAINAGRAAAAHSRLHPESGATFCEIGGGIAAFTAPGSPLTHAIGVGMNGPVTEADIEAIEILYRERECPAVNIDLCPLADPSLAEVLGQRGYRAVEFNNALARRIARFDAWPGDGRVRQIGPDDFDLWARTVMGGFFERADPAPEEVGLGETLCAMEDSAAFVAESDGAPAAGAAILITEGLAFLMGDSTLPRYRGRGLHRALIEARLACAVARECDLAVATTLPGTISQRNYQRCGFEILYTKLNMQRDFEPRTPAV